MTTGRGLDPQQPPGDDGSASANLSSRAPVPADATTGGDARISSDIPPPTELPDRLTDDGRKSGRDNASDPVLGDRRTGRGRGELDSVRRAGRPRDAAGRSLESDPAEHLEGATGQDDDHARTTERSGVDARRRGWFWHWNNVVTQYAPLIGLKGVGLLNSYTVWTDRRDESPHRGYAFPSQQSEADFYGEERAELITINKILVALDLIEIRKEMLTRVDERGRRWRVPHNLYRVKDRPDGVDLRAADVIRVAELAKRDQAVFRYVRRVFSDRFRPIDGDNVWHTILGDLRDDPTWRELQDRTRAIEARASARTRAGHKSRSNTTNSKPGAAQSSGSTETEADPVDRDLLPSIQRQEHSSASQPTSVERTNTGSRSPEMAVVDPSNNGSAIAVDPSNSGSTASRSTSVAARSNGRERVVGPSNTTYDQEILTTTTTTTGLSGDESAESALPTDAPSHHAGRSTSITDWSESSSGHGHNGSAGQHARSGERAANATVEGAVRGLASERRTVEGSTSAERSRAEEAGSGERVGDESGHGVGSHNGALDRRLDAQVEGDEHDRRTSGTRAGGGARERRLADPAAGGPLVDSGPLVVSTFEAANDRRATPLERHLLAELERDADPPARAAGSTGADWVVAAMREAVASGSAFVAPKRIREIITRWASDSRNAPSAAPSLTPSVGAVPTVDAATDTAADVRMPGGASGNAVWSTVLGDLARALDRDAFQRLLTGSRITRYWRGTVEVRVGSVAAADKLSNEYRGLIERHLNSRLRRPVAVCFEADAVVSATVHTKSVSDEVSPSDESRPVMLTEAEVEVGRQVWQSLLADLARLVTPADLDRMAGVVVLGQDASGVILLGTPSPHARRLIDGRYRRDVESSLAALLGQPAPVRVLDPSGWSTDPR
jgi:hypothetical protein